MRQMVGGHWKLLLCGALWIVGQKARAFSNWSANQRDRSEPQSSTIASISQCAPVCEGDFIPIIILSVPPNKVVDKMVSESCQFEVPLSISIIVPNFTALASDSVRRYE